MTKRYSFKLIITIFLSLITELYAAQDPIFSQFYNAPVYLNPALSGNNHGCPRLISNSRVQNFSSGAYITNAISSDRYVRKLKGGISCLLLNDISANIIINNAMYLAYSYHMRLSKNYSLLFGLQVGWHQNFLNWNILSFGDMIDPRKGFIYQSGDLPSGRVYNNGWGTRGYFDINSGLAFYSENFYGGIAIHHLNRPINTLINAAQSTRLPRRITGHIGAKFYLNDFILIPNIMYTSQNEFSQLNFGGNIQYKYISVGAFVRLNNTAIFSLGLHLDHFRLVYSYDMANKNYSWHNSSSHEVSLMYYF